MFFRNDDKLQFIIFATLNICSMKFQFVKRYHFCIGNRPLLHQDIPGCSDTHLSTKEIEEYSIPGGC